MDIQDYILIQQFCEHYNIPVSFVNALHELNLIETTTVEENLYLQKTQIKDLEKMMRLHYELEINLEGIDAINNLLKQVEALKRDILILNNKLNRFENY